MKHYKTLVNCHGHLMCAVDVETTGEDPDYHEIIQIACVPLDSDFEPYEGVSPLYANLAPQFPERAKGNAMTVNGLDLVDLALNAPHPDKVLDLFVDWFERLDLPANCRLIPLAHNWSFEDGFLRKWMGHKLFHHIFRGLPRDSMEIAIYQNDKANMIGEKGPYERVSLSQLCKDLGIVNENPHDALCDSLATAKLYKTLLLRDLY